jgi:thiol:disulfide interchange protein DsbD
VTRKLSIVLYAFSIAVSVIYVLLGFLVTWIFGADALNALSTNVWFNIIFFVLLVVLRLHSWVHLKLCCLILGQTKSIAKQIEEELLDFIYGIGTCNCIFSCTGPIVGTFVG